MTILPRYLDNTRFFLTNIHNYLHFYYPAFYSNFLIAFSSFIYSSKTAVQAVESSQFLIILARDRFFNFNDIYIVVH